jgi:hypothetical protein
MDMPLGCLWPKHRNPSRQAGLLAFGFKRLPNGLPAPPVRGTVALLRFGDLADHSGGPATDLHRFPFSPWLPKWKREPVETSRLFSNRVADDQTTLATTGKIEFAIYGEGFVKPVVQGINSRSLHPDHGHSTSTKSVRLQQLELRGEGTIVLYLPRWLDLQRPLDGSIILMDKIDFR